MDPFILFIAGIIALVIFIILIVNVIRAVSYLKIKARQTERTSMYLKKHLEKNGITEEEFKEINHFLHNKYY